MCSVTGIFVQQQNINNVKCMYASAPGHIVDCSELISMHSRMFCYMHTNIHGDSYLTGTNRYSCLSTCIHSYMDAWVHTHIYKYILTYIHSCMSVYINTYIFIWKHECI